MSIGQVGDLTSLANNSALGLISPPSALLSLNRHHPPPRAALPPFDRFYHLTIHFSSQGGREGGRDQIGGVHLPLALGIEFGVRDVLAAAPCTATKRESFARLAMRRRLCCEARSTCQRGLSSLTPLTIHGRGR